MVKSAENVGKSAVARPVSTSADFGPPFVYTNFLSPFITVFTAVLVFNRFGLWRGGPPVRGTPVTVLCHRQGDITKYFFYVSGVIEIEKLGREGPDAF